MTTKWSVPLAVTLLFTLAGHAKSESDPATGIDTHYSRYFFAPTAFPLQKGSGYIQTHWLAAWSANYGIAERGSIGFSTTIFGQPFFLTPKFGVKMAEDWSTGGGMMLGYIDGSPLGIGYGLSTLGDAKRNLTIGLGWAFGGGEVEQSPLLSINAMRQFAPSWTMMFESWILTQDPSDLHLLLYGVRWYRGGRNSLDLGFMIHREVLDSWNNSFSPGFPFVGWTFGF